MVFDLNKKSIMVIKLTNENKECQIFKMLIKTKNVRRKNNA